MERNFWMLIPDSLKKAGENKILFAYSALIVAFFALLSFGTAFIGSLIKSDLIFKIWSFALLLIIFLVLSFIFSEIIGISMHGRESIMHYGKIFAIRVFFVLIITWIAGQVIPVLIGHGIATELGKSILLSEKSAKIFFAVYDIAWKILVVIFLTFSSFYCIKDDLKVKEGIKKSMKYVKSNYINTLLSLTIFYALLEICTRYIPVYGGWVYTLLITPIISIWLSELISGKNEYSL